MDFQPLSLTTKGWLGCFCASHFSQAKGTTNTHFSCLETKTRGMDSNGSPQWFLKRIGFVERVLCQKRPGQTQEKTHQKFQVPKMEELNLIRLFWGVGFPLHKPYIQLIQVSTSILGPWNVWWKTGWTYPSILWFASSVVGKNHKNLPTWNGVLFFHCDFHPMGSNPVNNSPEAQTEVCN